MTDQQMEAMERDLTKASKTIRGLIAMAGTKLDMCELNDLARVRGVIEAHIDNLQWAQGKHPQAIR